MCEIFHGDFLLFNTMCVHVCVFEIYIHCNHNCATMSIFESFIMYYVNPALFTLWFYIRQI